MLTVKSVVFRSVLGVPAAFAITSDGREWRLSETEIVEALNRGSVSDAISQQYILPASASHGPR